MSPSPLRLKAKGDTRTKGKLDFFRTNPLRNAPSPLVVRGFLFATIYFLSKRSYQSPCSFQDDCVSVWFFFINLMNFNNLINNFLFLIPRVELLMHFLEPGICDMSINLSSRNICMTKHLLHSTKICTM